MEKKRKWDDGNDCGRDSLVQELGDESDNGSYRETLTSKHQKTHQRDTQPSPQPSSSCGSKQSPAQSPTQSPVRSPSPSPGIQHSIVCQNDFYTSQTPSVHVDTLRHGKDGASTGQLGMAAGSDLLLKPLKK